MRLIYLIVIILLNFSALNVSAQTNPDFYLHENGVTVMCPDAEVGETGAVDGAIYKKIGDISELVFNGGSVFADAACTSDLTDLSNAFYKEENEFNLNISTWDVSNVITMENMFRDATSFNRDISNWDVSNVITMENMFREATSFNTSLSGWDVGKVLNMYGMFFKAAAFNQPINDWNVSKVENMEIMFREATNFNQELSNWDVKNVLSMVAMFKEATTFNKNINTWDISENVDIRNLFQGATSFNQNINDWDVSGITSMVLLFQGASSFDKDLNNWDVGNVEEMSRMFDGATSFNKDISNWNVSSVERMNGMFTEATSFNKDISSWDVSNVNYMDHMFEDATSFNQDISNWNVSKVFGFSRMFKNASSFYQDLSGWCAAWAHNVTEFAAGTSLPGNFIPKWGESCNSEQPASVVLFSPQNNAEILASDFYFEWSSSQHASSYILELSTLNDFSSVLYDSTFTAPDTSMVITQQILANDSTYFWRVKAANGELESDWSDVFNFSTNPEPPESVTLTSPQNNAEISASEPYFEWSTSQHASSYVFELSTHNDFSSVLYDSTFTAPDTSMMITQQILANDSTYFWRVKAANGELESDWSDIFSFTTTSSDSTNPDFYLHENGVTVMCPDAVVGETGAVDGTIYEKIGAINDLEVHGGDVSADLACTSGITDMKEAFKNIDRWDFPDLFFFNKDISHWDVSSVTNMSSMFQEASRFEGKSGMEFWDVSNVTDMSSMFQGAVKFNKNIGSWDVSNVTDMSGMFTSSNFNQDISSWDVSNVTNMARMFEFTDFNQNISSWDVSNVTIMESMFLNSPFNQNISSWNVSSVTNMAGMFSSVPFNQDISSWDVSNVTTMKEMFRGNVNFNQNIDSWDVSNVTDMEAMFYTALVFNGDISSWDVSNVNTMESMFATAKAFNQNISSWDVSNVTDMFGTFRNAQNFNQDISSWDVSKVAHMSIMFNEAEKFNQDISSWDVSSVSSMTAMFFNAKKFNQDIGAWNVSNVTAMDEMFRRAFDFNQDISKWCVKNISSEPNRFAEESDLSPSNFPKWGTCLGRPGNIELQIPIDDAEDISLSPSFSWEEGTDATSYQLQVFDDSDHMIADTVVNDVTFEITDTLQSVQTYHWKVRGINDDKNIIGNWSETWSFTTVLIPPSIVSLLTPTNSSTDVSVRPEFDWKKSSLAEEYLVQIAEDDNFDAIFIDSVLTQPDFTTSKNLQFDSTYYWRVKAINEAGESAWSETWSFTTIVEAPNSSTLLFPENGSEVNTLLPEIIWSQTPRAHTYKFELTDTQTFAYSIIDSSVTDTTFLPSAKLENATKYYWRVKAFGDGGESEWSETFTFFIPFSVSINPEDVPDKFSLSQNYPNPFNPSTQINYTLANNTHVKLRVFNALGQQVATLVDERKSAGNYSITFDATSLSSGFYFYSIEAGDFRQTKKMLLIK